MADNFRFADDSTVVASNSSLRFDDLRRVGRVSSKGLAQQESRSPGNFTDSVRTWEPSLNGIA